MRFTYTVEVEVERDEGKFESRDSLGAEIQQALEDADPGSITGDNGGTYSTSTWEVSES